MADRQPAGGVEELQVRGVDGQRRGRARPDRAARGNPRGPQRLILNQRDGLVIAGLGDAGVLDRRRVDREDDVNLAAELLGHADLYRHPCPSWLGKLRVFEVRRSDAQDDLLAEISFQAGTGREQLVGDGELVPGEGNGGAVVADELGGDEVHRGRADEACDEQVDGRVVERLWRVYLLQPAVPKHADALA